VLELVGAVGDLVVVAEESVPPVVTESVSLLSVGHQSDVRRHGIVFPDDEGCRQFDKSAIGYRSGGKPKTNKQKKLAKEHLEDTVVQTASWQCNETIRYDTKPKEGMASEWSRVE